MHWLRRLSRPYFIPYHDDNGAAQTCTVYPDERKDLVDWPQTNRLKSLVVDRFLEQLENDPKDYHVLTHLDRYLVGHQSLGLSDAEFANAMSVEYERLEYQWRADDDDAELREEKIALLRELNALQRWLTAEALIMVANAKADINTLDSAAAERMIAATKATVNGY
jgi:hypothetical protein